jgi:hypothetical protein
MLVSARLDGPQTKTASRPSRRLGSGAISPTPDPFPTPLRCVGCRPVGRGASRAAVEVEATGEEATVKCDMMSEHRPRLGDGGDDGEMQESGQVRGVRRLA